MKRVERIKPGQPVRAEDMNRIIDAINSLTITVGQGLQMKETVGGILLALDLGPEKKTVIVEAPVEPA
jgi:hypothetical protein